MIRVLFPSHANGRASAVSCFLAAFYPVAVLAQPSHAKGDRDQRDVVVVIATTPLDQGTQAESIPAAVTRLDNKDLTRTGAADVLGALGRQVGSVSLNEAQANPFQPNLLYRGFEASPLPGNAQGLAVYVDGVRFNQPFGDTVDWDLVPDWVELVARPNPTP